jgi:hypothetical protein
MINIHFHNIKWAVIPSQGYADSFDSFLFKKKIALILLVAYSMTVLRVTAKLSIKIKFDIEFHLTTKPRDQSSTQRHDQDYSQ